MGAGRRNGGRAAQGWLDLENLLTPWTDADAAKVAARFVALVRGLRGVLPGVALVGCGHRDLVTLLASQVPGAAGVRLFGGACGPDRADRELVSRLAGHVWQRTGTVVIGSGDHAFADVGRRLRASGRRVLVLGRRGAVSWELYPASDGVLLLEDLWAGQAIEVAA